MTAMRGAPSEISPARGNDNEWLTAREIAAEELPDLPATESAVIRRAEREDWDNTSLARKRGGRGGATEYHVSLFPLLARVAITQRRMRVVVPETPKPEIKAEPNLSAQAKLARDARLSILAAFDRFSQSVTLNFATRMQVFVDKYNAGSLAVDDWTREAVPTLSKRTLLRFRVKKRNGANALAHDPAMSRKGTGVLDRANGGRVRAFMLGLIAHQPHLPAEEVRTQCRAEFGDFIEVALKGETTRLEMPPVRTFQHSLKRLKEEHRVELIKLTNPDKYRSELALSGVGTLRHVTETNQLWQIDASPADALCLDGRHSVYGCIDIATRRTIWLVSRTPRASAVGLLLRKAILAWGVPTMVVTDNGSDFVARATKQLFASLEIDPDTSSAYSPEQKGHIERAIRTFQHNVGPLLPGFIGHSVADRKTIESRKSFAQRLGETEAETFGVSLTGETLQRHVDEWALVTYQHRAHSGLQGETPFQAALRSTVPVLRVEERALDVLLMPVVGLDGRRTVTKFGIRHDNFHYLVPELLPGTTVFVRQDPQDAGRLFAFTEDGATFLAEAVCPELSGIDPRALVQTAKEIHRELLDDRTRDIKAEMKRIAKGRPLIERHLDVKRRDMPNVIPLPARTETHSTPQVAAALAAFEAKLPKPAPAMSEGAASRYEQLRAELAAPVSPTSEKVTQLHVAETAANRFARMFAIERRRDAGETLTTDEAYALGAYQQSAEYKARKMLAELGDQAPALGT